MKDIKNQKFDRLFVINKSHKDKYGRWYWQCRCDCGKYLTIIGSSLRSGHTKSCGCLNRELSSQRAKIFKTIHGDSVDKILYKLHRTWRGMLDRCNNPNSKYYARYGGRRISVCNEWQEYVPFRNWAISNNWKPGLAIDRIDNNGNYCPENCQWLTRSENSRKSNK